MKSVWKSYVTRAAFIPMSLVMVSCQPPQTDHQEVETAVNVALNKNMALNKTVTSSGAEESFPPANAIDGSLDTRWVVAGDAPGWIEVDLQGAFLVQRIELVVEQTPEGETAHRILGRASKDQEYLELHVFEGLTRDGQVLAYTPAEPTELRFIRVETSRTPSWVAWKEIRVFSPAR